eukprot:5381692-Prymnesium_polylepis.1
MAWHSHLAGACSSSSSRDIERQRSVAGHVVFETWTSLPGRRARPLDGRPPCIQRGARSCSLNPTHTDRAFLRRMAPPSFKCYADAEARLDALMRAVKDAARCTAVLEPKHTHCEAVKAALALAQAARNFYFLVSDAGVAEADATACTADLEKAADVYASWAKGLLSCASLPARRLLLAPLAATI